MKMQRGIYFDQTRCTGCQTCVVACKDWHDTPAGPSRWLWVTTHEEGKFPNPTVSFLIHCCHHCVNPSCELVCPGQAITKRDEDGIVVVDRERCIGKGQCGVCLDACPYKAPQFGAEPESRMEKCDLCLERWREGKKPICVESCPTRALDAGFLDGLEKTYGRIREANGFTFSSKLKPAIFFKPKEPGPRQPQ